MGPVSRIPPTPASCPREPGQDRFVIAGAHKQAALNSPAEAIVANCADAPTASPKLEGLIGVSLNLRRGDRLRCGSACISGRFGISLTDPLPHKIDSR